ncbi:MAG: PHP domain-containing protein [Defluviitaleaceae bacterium]|nr:PHP domain-containing protein [Defluviitaleaceae bacterium]
MIYDLHMHSNCSDGSDSWETILQKAEKAGLDYISITDHENCDVYYKMKDPQKYFSGKIIVGIELVAFFKGIVIEILGYGFDTEKMREAIKGLYMPVDKVHRIELERLYNRCLEIGMEFAPGVPERYDKNVHFFSTIYLHSEMRKFPGNRRFVPDDESWERENIFFRRYTSNPDSPFYIDASDLFPSAAKVIGLIRSVGGKAVVPHVYQYGEHSDIILNGLLEDCDIDGLECFYPSFTREQTAHLISICRERALLVSGGSDYHGQSRPELEIGMMNDLIKEMASNEAQSVAECIG